jgi:DMSO reductase family type II enzyme heme b subunit
MMRAQASGRRNRDCFAIALGLGLAAAAACAGKGPTADPPATAQSAAVQLVKTERTPDLSPPAKPAGPAKAESVGTVAIPTKSAAVAIGSPILARGEALFAKQCSICHGETGDGAGKFAYLMNPRPRNLQQGNFKLSTTENQIPTEDDLLRTISRGMPGSAMPPWGHLPSADLQALVKYVRRIHLEAAKAEAQSQVAPQTDSSQGATAWLTRRTQPGPPLVIPPEPMFGDLQWFRGRRLYLEACASCHGVDGHPVANAVKFDNEGFPVPPRSFVNGIFKGGSESHQLYARIVKGVKGTPMPSSEGVYANDEVWDLIHYVQSLAKLGAQERAQLRQGTFSAPYAAGALPSGPMDAAWNQARPLYVGLTPLWWTEERIEGLVVQALHNDTDLALRFAWLDPTVDERGVRHDEFRDAVAVQFALSSDPPFYMGSAGEHGDVNIWMWKADRQKNIAGGYQDVDAAFPNRAVDMYPEQAYRLVDMTVTEWPHEVITKHSPEFITAWGAGNLVADPQIKTPVECLVARGPGTLAGKPANFQIVEGQAVYERGVWYVQMQRSLELPHAHGEADERIFRSGDYLPVSFAIWNGSAGDRDGKKNISIWQKLVIE